MIRVTPRPESPNFDASVRAPGAAFLAETQNPTSEQFRKKNYWSRAARDLHVAYQGICAYTAMYLPEQGSVDHFLPKTLYPNLAYEWTNFRLASGRVNSSKGNATNILDPFLVEDDWFHLDIPSCLLKANPTLDHVLKGQINSTINSLRLNVDDNYVQERCNILIDFARQDISSAFLERRYPFLAKQVGRLQLAPEELRSLFKI